jgi:hypothetical protein
MIPVTPKVLLTDIIKNVTFFHFFRQNTGGRDYYAAGAALLQVRKQEVFLIFIIFVPNYRYVS